jgi:hypothetical protein
MAARSLAGELRRRASRTLPSSSTTPAAILVPPTSTPIDSDMFFSFETGPGRAQEVG